MATGLRFIFGSGIFSLASPTKLKKKSYNHGCLSVWTAELFRSRAVPQENSKCPGNSAVSTRNHEN